MVKIFVKEIRLFLFVFRLAYPYINWVKYVDFNHIMQRASFRFKYKSKEYQVEFLQPTGEVIGDNDKFIICDNDAMTFPTENYKDIKRFKKENVFALYIEGEAYQITPNIEAYLKNGYKVISSFLPSSLHPDKYDFSKFHSHPNVLDSYFAGIVGFTSRQDFFLNQYIGSHQLIPLGETSDIAFYSRYGYKEWRDISTDFFRNILKDSPLAVNEIKTFRELNDDEVIHNPDKNELDSYYINQLIEAKSFLHYLYFFDMFDSKLHIVYETSLEEANIFSTEKVYKEIVFGFPFYCLQPITTRKYLKELGFYSFDMDEWPNKYPLADDEFLIRYPNVYINPSHVEEINRYRNFIDFISTMNKDEFKNFILKYKPKFDNNRKLWENYITTESIYRNEILDFIIK